jgi:hypothetical protein
MAVYLSHDTAGVIQSQIDEERVRALVRELEDVEDLLRGARNESVTAAVDEQTGRITDGPIAQYDAMRALLSLGAPAIPAIAQRLDDFRALPSRSIMLENPPAFFEAFGTYGITSVTDALIVILERLSANGPACEGILNSDEDHTLDDLRRSCIARWRAWTLHGVDEGAFGAGWQRPPT